MDNYLNAKDVPKRFPISERQLERWRTEGGGPSWIRIGSRKVAYRISDIESWLSGRTFEHRAAELRQSTEAEASDARAA